MNEQMLDDAKVIVNQLKDMSVKYGDKWLGNLVDFEGCALLREYHDKISKIEKSTKTKANGGSITVEENMKHLLYHLMNQHFISFSDMANTLEASDVKGVENRNPTNLSGSFKLSEKHSHELVEDDNEGSYAWFSNMKLPDTFTSNSAVQNYYKKLSDVFSSSKNVKVRRMHLFYNDLIGEKDFIKPLFTVLFVEKLMRIESKVVLVKNFDTNKYHFFHIDWKLNPQQLESCRAFLLDFALFHNRGKDKSIYGNYISLFSNFCFEKLEDKDTYVQNRKEKYDKEKVYSLSDYNIFHILKSYYLSLWNKDKYMRYLDDLNKSNSNNKRIKAIVDFYHDDNIQVLDLFEFWSQYLNSYGVADIFDENIFKSLYSWETYKSEILKKSDTPISQIKKTVLPKIIELLTDLKEKMKDNISEDGTWNKNSFDNLFEADDFFNPYFLRNKIE